MQKYLELLLELLRPADDEITTEEKKGILAAGEKLQGRGDRNLMIAHKYGFVFSAYDDLIHERISLDEFLATGDITSKKNLNKKSESSISVINSIIDGTIETEENTLFILDTISFGTLSNNEKQIVQEWTKNHNCELVFC